ncbi:CRISPR-associated protein [Deinococcus aquaticus]|uniref:CRISPR-associated protein n=1 Tax=Deinococcus aquaticus TaxID=328692 RepID=UPI003F45EE9D
MTQPQAPLPIPEMDGIDIPDLIRDPGKRHDFMFIFEANNANPNGDPDMDNMPRTEPDQNHGLATDTSIKRKIRDIAAMLGHDIFIEPSQTLNRKIGNAFGAVPQTPLTEEELDNEALMEQVTRLQDLELFTLDDTHLMYLGDDPRKLDKEITRDLPKLPKVKAGEESTDRKPVLKGQLEAIARRMKSSTNDKMMLRRDDARDHLVRQYYDIRMFGAVLSAGLNAGQVLGPVTLTPARSVTPVTLMQLGITRNAKNTTARAETGNTEMGRRHIISHGLYVAYGHYDPMAGGRLGVSQEDLHLLWYALTTSFMHTRSAARSDINVRGLYVFTHDHPLGNALSHKLFDRITVTPTTDMPMSYSDYTVQLPENDAIKGVTFTPVTHQ